MSLHLLCEKCGEEFNEPFALARHLSTHIPEEPTTPSTEWKMGVDFAFPDTSDAPNPIFYDEHQELTPELLEAYDKLEITELPNIYIRSTPTQSGSFADLYVVGITDLEMNERRGDRRTAVYLEDARAAHRASQEQLLDTAAERLLAVSHYDSQGKWLPSDELITTVINDLKKGLK